MLYNTTYRQVLLDIHIQCTEYVKCCCIEGLPTTSVGSQEYVKYVVEKLTVIPEL